jgi:hypothetical protein
MHPCPVCLYPGLSEPARSPKSGGGSYEICPCCGFQHGVDDDDKGITYSQARTAWVKAGAKWTSQATPPPQNWAAKSQLLSGPKSNALTRPRDPAKPIVATKSVTTKTARR